MVIYKEDLGVFIIIIIQTTVMSEQQEEPPQEQEQEIVNGSDNINEHDNLKINDKENGKQEQLLEGAQSNAEKSGTNPQSKNSQAVEAENAGQAKSVDIFGGQDEQQQQGQRFPQVFAFLENNVFQGFVTLLTIYALFGDDIRIMAFDNDADLGFDVINIICLIVFFLEIILSIIAKPGYFLSFFFWLDFISTLSLLLDIQMFLQAVGLSGDTNQAANTAQLARAGRASRVGTKAGRVVRLVRLIRIVKLYKTASKDKKDKAKEMLAQRRKKKKIHPNQPTENQGNTAVEESKVHKPEEQKSEDEEQNLKESRVSKRLSDLTTKRVIIIVLALMFIIPLFQTDYYSDPPNSMAFQTTIFAEIAQSEHSTQQILKDTFAKIIEEHQGIDTPMALLASPFSFIDKFKSPQYDILRVDEQDVGSATIDLDKFKKAHPTWTSVISELEASSDLTVLGALNGKSIAQTKALLSFLRTIFVCIVLTFGSLMFSKDANDLALRPIERMIDKVNKIARNPQIAKEQRLQKDQADQNETIKIENAIIKIGTLLALGFGDAGSEIVGSNMAKTGDVDPMLPGKKKCAIYGFCDIRNFTDATEVLQEDVMLFVNNIGHVVHTIVDRYAGAANKNIGDAFLLVWKLEESKYTIQEDGNIVWHDEKYVTMISECAILSFMKIQAKLNREPKILAYRLDQRLLNRMPGYKVKMGFGLHMGWGIEGAIGSEFKIDASYLSPNVNMASRLEAATKQYGVPILISSDLHNKFSKDLQEYTRQIDVVTVKGSVVPVGFYTIDMDVDDLPPSKDPAVVYADFSKDDFMLIENDKKQQIKELLDASKLNAVDLFEENKDLHLIMKTFNHEFNKHFKEAFQMYVDGDWPQCKEHLQKGLTIKKEDGPTQTIMTVMEEYKFKAPADWKGYRVLTEK